MCRKDERSRDELNFDWVSADILRSRSEELCDPRKDEGEGEGEGE